MAVDKDAGSRGRTAGAFDGQGLVRALANAGRDERAEREAVRGYLAELSEAAREAKLDALRSGVAEARERREKEKPPPDRWTLVNGLEQREEEVGREWRLAARSVAAGLDEFVQSDPQKDRGWLQRDIAALKSPEYDPFAQRRGGVVDREAAESTSPARAGAAVASQKADGTPGAPSASKPDGDRDADSASFRKSLTARLMDNPENPEAVLKQAVHEYLEEAGSNYLDKLEKALDAGLRTPAAKVLEQCDALKQDFRKTEQALVVQADAVKRELKEQPDRQSPAREKSPDRPADPARESVRSRQEDLGSRFRDSERAREARADMEGGPRAFAAGVTYRLGLQIAAARGEDALARMGERIEGSTRAQAGLRTVGADPLLVAAAAAMTRKRGGGSPQVVDVLTGRTSEPVRSRTAVLAADMLNAHRQECSEFPDRASRKEEVWERSRRTVAAGPAAESAARVLRTWGAACSAEISAARGGRVEKAPPDGWKPGPGLERAALSDRGRAAVAEARKNDPVALQQFEAQAGRVVDGRGRGAVRSLAGRRAEGFNRVRQLADGLPGRVMAPVSRGIVAWAARGDVTRQKRAGAVIGRSKWLSAGVVAARVDPALIAVSVSKQCASSLAEGKTWTPRAGDNRRLGQLAVEVFERHDRRESGGAAGEKAARDGRVRDWRDAVSSGVAKELREVHSSWDGRKNHESCEFRDKKAEEARVRAGRDPETHENVGRVRHGEQLWAQPSAPGRERKSFAQLFTRKQVPGAGGGRVIFRAKQGVAPKTREALAHLLEQSGYELEVSDQRDGRVVVEPSRQKVAVSRKALKGKDRDSLLLVAAASALVSARTDGAPVDGGAGLAAVGMVASRVAREQGLDYRPPTALSQLKNVSEDAVVEGTRHAREVADLVARRLDGQDRPSPEAQTRLDAAHAGIRRATIDNAHDRVVDRQLDQTRAQTRERDLPTTQTLNLRAPAVAPAR